jgi:hypothetical protein
VCVWTTTRTVLCHPHVPRRALLRMIPAFRHPTMPGKDQKIVVERVGAYFAGSMT